MKIFCLKRFKEAYDDLSKKKSYRSLEKELIDYFFNKEINQLLSGTRLNNSQNEPFIKKRIDGRGGFRIYYLVLIKHKNVYLMFVHPKTGSEGSDNITEQSKALIYKEVLACIRTNELFELTLNKDGSRIEFSLTNQ